MDYNQVVKAIEDFEEQYQSAWGALGGCRPEEAENWHRHLGEAEIYLRHLRALRNELSDRVERLDAEDAAAEVPA